MAKKLIILPSGTLYPNNAKKKIEKPAPPPAKKKPKRLKIMPKGTVLPKKEGKKRLIITKRLPPKPKDDSGKQLKSYTGLDRKQANKANPLELFGMLPQELRKNILLPSKRGGGVKVGQMPISKFTFADVDFNDMDPDFSENAWQSMAYDADYTEYAGYRVLTDRQDKYYQKHYLSYAGGEYDEKMESLEGKISERLSTIEMLLMKKEFREWKKKNKGKTGSSKEFSKEFGEYFDDPGKEEREKALSLFLG
jgi:hypothetical protein